MLTLDRDGDFRCGARWRASGNQLHLEKELYYPDSLGDLYSRVTELLGFGAGRTNTKCSGCPPRDSGEQFLPLFEELLGSQRLAVHRPHFFDSGSLEPRRLQREILRARWGSRTAPTFRKRCAAPLAAGLQRAIEDTVLRMAGPAEISAWPADWG